MAEVSAAFSRGDCGSLRSRRSAANLSSLRAAASYEDGGSGRGDLRANCMRTYWFLLDASSSAAAFASSIVLRPDAHTIAWWSFGRSHIDMAELRVTVT